MVRSLKLIASLLVVTAYPFAVYFGLQRFSPRVIVIGLAGLLGLRMFAVHRQALRTRLPYIAGIAGLIVLAAHSPMLGLKSYPILISLAFALIFGYSLLRPPSIIEEIVRLRDPGLPAEASGWLRNVTFVWMVFFLINASISAATALCGSIKLWTLYNGFISYLLIGGLLAGEFVLRPAVGARSTAWRS